MLFSCYNQDYYTEYFGINGKKTLDMSVTSCETWCRLLLIKT